MANTREAALSGSNIVLRAVFTDQTGALVSADATPSVYIYDPSIDSATMDAEIEAETYDSAIAGPLSPNLLSAGYYQLTYSIPSLAETGPWRDVWQGNIRSVTQKNVLSFNVVEGADVSTQQLTNNKLIVISLSAEIANADNTKTLTGQVLVGFSTIYKPLYASPDMLRAEVGRWIGNVADDTLAFLLHWSSKEVDFVSPRRISDPQSFAFAKARFVIFDTALKILNLPGGPSGQVGATGSSGARKQLGNLSITSGMSNVSAVNSAGIDKDTLKHYRDQRNEWWRVVNAGGRILPGQGFDPQLAIRGIGLATGRRNSGRLWAPESQTLPTSNTKDRDNMYELSRFRYTDLKPKR